MKQQRLRTSLLLVASLFIVVLNNSCQRNLSDPGPDPIEDPPTFSFVKAVVTGRVLDDQEMPVSGATVKAGTVTGTTSINGEFKLENVLLNEDAGFVRVEKEGFFQGSRTFLVKANATHYVQIELIKKSAAGTFSGSGGGNVTVPNGGSISFPAAAIVNASNNTAYTGAVTLHASFLNPEADNFDNIMPGALRGVNASDQPVILQSFGMMAVELVGAGGEKLQLASGKEATISFPIPASLQGQAPTTIPLWSFNDTTGLWKEEGSATRQGNNYVGKTSHFSFWNCDVPSNFIQFKATIKNQNNDPVKFSKVVITDLANGSTGVEYTNNMGEVAGPVPVNKNLKLEVYNICDNLIHSQNIGPFAVNTDVGTVMVASTGTTTVTFTGTAVNCTAGTVTNGFVNIRLEDGIYRTNIVNGNFSIEIDRCTAATTTAEVWATDFATNEQGTEMTVNVSGSSVNTGALTACGTTAAQYINFSIDGTQYNMIPPVDSLKADFLQGLTIFSGNYQGGSGQSRSIYGTFPGSSTGTLQLNDLMIYVNNLSYRKSGSINATITEYGAPGSGFISGTLTGNIVRDSTSTPVYPFDATFRIKRQN